MRVLGITPAVKEERTLSFKDLSVYCKRAVNLSPNATQTEKPFCHKRLTTISRKPVKLYDTDYGKVVYCADKKLYSLVDGKLMELCTLTFESLPEVFSIRTNGKTSLCAVENSSGVIVGDVLSFVNFPKGRGYTIKDGVLFCYKGDKIVFGDRYEYSGYNVSVSEKGFIGVENTGDILRLFSDGKKIIAVCERGIANLYPDGFYNDYRLEYSTVRLDLKNGDDVKLISDTLYFFKDGGLYSVKNDTIKRLNTVLDNAEYNGAGNAFTMGDSYFLPVLDGENKYIFVYDTVTDSSYFISADADCYSDGGYYAVTDGYAVGKLELASADSYEWQSVNTDFGSDAEKTLYKISIKTLSPLTLTVKGDYGTRLIKVDGGYKSVRLNLKSREFSFKLNGDVKPFGVEYMKIYYRI